MHCLHIVPTYWPAMRYGGTVAAVHGLCKALAGRGHRVTVLTSNADGERTLDVPLDSPVDVDGVDVRYFPLALYRPCYAPAMGKAIAGHVRDADVVHLHSVFLWPTWAGARAARRACVPYVLSPRGMLVDHLIRRKSRWLKSAWLRVCGRDVLRHAAAIHVTSELERETLAAAGCGLSDIRVIENGVDPIAAPVDDAQALRGMGLPVDRPFVLYLGRISWKKGLDRLVLAMRHVGSAQLIVVGNDDESHWPHIQTLIEQERMQNRVRYCGPVYDDRKWALLRAAACLVLPSYSENFGNTVLEAMGAACPVVVTPEVGAAHLVRNAEAGFVVDGDPEALGRAISRFVEDGALRARMGDAGARAVRERHGWPQRADEMLSLYEDVMRRAREQARGVAA